MAANLARSFFWWHQNTDISFYIATDNRELLPNDIISLVKIITIQPGELGEGFSPKLHLDKLAPVGQTLFIDSDCLIFGRLDFVFERFKGHKVSVVGTYISDGEWFGDVSRICSQFNVPYLPKFNGGIYYLENSPESAVVYSKARELEKQYDQIGFKRLRNRPNDEVLMALAMQLHHQTPIIDDSSIMSDPQACQGGYFIDVIRGKRWLINPPMPSPLHQGWYPFQKVTPVIVHFLGHYTLEYPYKREIYRLKKYTFGRWGKVYDLYSLVAITLPGALKKKMKATLRPVYHAFFGTRSIKPSERL